MKKVVLFLAMLCTVRVMAEDSAPPNPPKGAAVCPLPEKVAPAPKSEKHGFFHPLVHFWSHTVGHGMIKGAGVVHDGIAGKAKSSATKPSVAARQEMEVKKTNGK